MLEWAKVKRHRAEEITLLCYEHHGQKTKGLLPVEAVKEADSSPYNLRNGVSKSTLLHYSGNSDISFSIGRSILNYPNLPNNTLVVPILIDGHPIVSFAVRENNLVLSYVVYNENNDLIFSIQENELVYSTGLWDVEWVGKTLTIREKKGKILLKLRFNPPNNVQIINARILCNGVEVHARKNYIACLNNNIYLGKFEMKNGGPPLGFYFGRRKHHIPCFMYVGNIPRYNINREEKLKWLRACIKKSKNKKKKEKYVNFLELQIKLKEKGFYKGPVNGIFSIELKKALRSYMDENN